MQAVTQPTIDATIISSGVDWITGTNEGGSVAHESDLFASDELNRVLDAGGVVKPESRLGYVGHASEGFFYGGRGHGRMMIASGATAHNLYRSIKSLSDHISRVDLQVTVWTHGEQPNLAVQAYRAIQGHTPAHVRVRNCTLITSQPEGDTINVGKRSSDQCGRIYDKASQAKLGTARTVWRYEVEFKRGRAQLALASLTPSSSDKAATRQVVRRWFERRGIVPCFAPAQPSDTSDLSLAEPKRDTLRWFRDSLSKTVARQVAIHGEAEVLKALGFEDHLVSFSEGRK